MSSPLPEYALLHNGTLHQGAVTVPAGQYAHIPAGDGGTIDLTVSFELNSTTTSGGFGVSVKSGAATAMVEKVAAAASGGGVTVSLLFNTSGNAPCALNNASWCPRLGGWSSVRSTVQLAKGETLDMRFLVRGVGWII